jgi:hypothetical protein
MSDADSLVDTSRDPVTERMAEGFGVGVDEYLLRENEFIERWAVANGDGLPSWFERVWRTAWMFSIVGAYPTALALGLPAYFMLRRHFSTKLISCASVGAIVAALPWVPLVLLSAARTTEASLDGRTTVINGHTTAYGWLTNAEFILQVGLFGAVGGSVFWLVAAAGHGSNRRSTNNSLG